MDRWPSGRRRLPAKEVYEQSYRGFESLPIRQTPPHDTARERIAPVKRAEVLYFYRIGSMSQVCRALQKGNRLVD